MFLTRVRNTNPCSAKPILSCVRLKIKVKMTLVPRAIAWFVIWSGTVVTVAAWGQTAPPSGQPAAQRPPANAPAASQPGPQQPPFQVVPPPSPFDVAPPGVEEALRERAAKFYQCYVEDKVRESEQYVLPEDRDAYYSVKKPHIFKFQILEVRFKNNYTRANVAMLINQDIAIPGVQVLRLDVPRPSYWVLQDGTWYYSMTSARPGEKEMTPFGERVVPDPKDRRPQVLFTREDLDKRVKEAEAALAGRSQAPRATKAVAELNPATNFHDEIMIMNQSPTPYHFHVQGTSLPPALVIEPTQGEMKANGPLTIKFSLPAAAAAQIVRDEPTVVVVLDGTPLAVTLRVRILGPAAPDK